MTSPDATDLTARVEAMPFASGLGIRNVRGGPDGIVATVDWAAKHCTGGSTLHGGYLMTVADTLGALCAGANLPPGTGTTTIESKTNFLRGVTSGSIQITSEPLHVGRMTIVVQTDITRDDGKLVTRTTQTQAVLQPR